MYEGAPATDDSVVRCINFKKLSTACSSNEEFRIIFKPIRSASRSYSLLKFSLFCIRPAWCCYGCNDALPLDLEANIATASAAIDAIPVRFWLAIIRAMCL